MKRFSFFSFLIFLLSNISTLNANGLNLLKIETSAFASYSGSFDRIYRSKDDILTIYYDLLSSTLDFEEYNISIFENDKKIFSLNDTLKIGSISFRPLAENMANYTIIVSSNGKEIGKRNFVCYTVDHNKPIVSKGLSRDLYYLIVAIFALILIFLFFLHKKSKKKSNDNFAPRQQENLKVISDLRLRIEELEYEKTRLKERIEELKKQVKELENINDMLIEKRDKLIENQNKLNYLNAEKEKLFAAWVHEIKNPASNLYAFAKLIQSYQLSAEEQNKAIESLISSSERILKIAENISKIAASSESALNLNIKKTNIKKIIDKVCAQNKSYAARKFINLLNKTSDDLPEVECDEEKIELAIENIVNNAIKYTGPNKSVIIQGYFTYDKIILEIIDEGQGIKQEDLPLAFQKGKILSSKPTGGESQSGLGLWIVKNIIEDHKGKILIESKLGIGSKVTIELPIKRYL